MRKTKEQKAITLIALIITIVVLLILAAVAIASIQNDGILSYAQNAAKDYNQAVKNEQDMLAEYLNYLDKNVQSGESADSLVAMYKAGTLKVGDYVDYNPATNADGTAKTYAPDGSTKGSLTGYTDGDLQNIVQEDLNWRVLGYDATKNELLLISGAPTINPIAFYGAVAYNNYEDVLYATCNNLYSNTTIGATARSMTMEDIDTYLGGSAYDKTTFGGGSTSSGGYGYNNPSVSSKFSVDAQTGRLTKVDTAVTLNLTSNAYYYTASDVITDATKLEILLGKNAATCPYYNWVASRFVYVGSSRADWCFGLVGNGYVYARYLFCASGGGEGGQPVCFRPVVSLSSSVTVTDVPVLETAPTETWNDPLGMY